MRFAVTPLVCPLSLSLTGALPLAASAVALTSATHTAAILPLQARIYRSSVTPSDASTPL
jgi:hypothetical protein